MPVRRHLDECGSNPLAVAILVGRERRINSIRKRHRGPRCRSVLWDAAVWSRGCGTRMSRVFIWDAPHDNEPTRPRPLIAFHAFHWIIGFVSPVVDLPLEQLKRQLRVYKSPRLKLTVNFRKFIFSRWTSFKFKRRQVQSWVKPVVYRVKAVHHHFVKHKIVEKNAEGYLTVNRYAQ